ncbi:UDP-N-acetylmuramoylalanine--D-glutamate ligase [Vallitalea longa]|uniref:UDP-N-acetylmuramoylalanine--D-glutamate ligase n=1 Tax=Vallitalea longa TaxID=2936439 RepID=A0A9W5YAE9_9FIRM|nr:UDP-N-acetylmuramoyl-L-alanine--D-glutamate ligase [Vallitalea longa]GKX29076.1 UDP-N-acetylmuramoylalanine--D-glutamate ligase [Vallitalea longa]
MELRDKNILVIGMALSGISAAKLCLEKKANVTVYDGKSKEQLIDSIKLLDDFKPKFIFGDFDYTILNDTDLIIISPGVPLDLPFVKKAYELNIPVWSEIELSYRFCESDIVAITGTNGKTTTTTLVGQIMESYYDSTYVVGNIGIPFSQIVCRTNEDSKVIAEISSFQLETIHEFAPRVSAILNITPDHLNRHKTYENYINAKLRITENQTKDDFCILNYDNEICRDLVNKITCNVYFFSKESFEYEKGVYIKNGLLCTNINNKEEKIIDVTELGEHNVENIMAAVAITLCMNVPLNVIKDVIKNFKGVAHRVEYVTTIKGVKYFNDSKATNEDAAINGIKSMKSNTILIGGGMDKGSSYDDWIKAFDNKVRGLILFGETAHKIENAARENGFNEIYQVDTLEEAVYKAYSLAKSGENVLLSPACASWDMFKNFEERGNLFKQCVYELESQ